MHSLEVALQDHELIVLRVIGEWWELDLTGEDKAASVTALAERLAQLDMPQELLYLPPEEANALQALVAENGRVPVAAFSREHGEVRLMGPGRLEREEPWFDPASPAEALWYRGFLYRGFDETAEGMIEFYYLPDELLAQFPQEEQAAEEPAADASAWEPAAVPASWATAVTDAVDDLTTLLALAQQTQFQSGGLDWPRYLRNPEPNRRSLLLTLAREMGFLREVEAGLRPTRTAVHWLQQSREAQLRALADAWSSSAWNDLCHTPDLVCEGEGWSNDPILARTALLDTLPRSADWFHIDDVTAFIKENDPDFQRPDGNYDVWYIREKDEADYITGFANWDKVEGRLLPFLLRGPLCWLGLTEIGGDCFRLTARALAWLAETPPLADEVRMPLIIQADGSLLVPHNAGRYERFQAARVCDAEPVEPGKPYQYRLTPQSLAQARQEGIAPDRILQFLAEASEKPLPASVKRAVERWGEHGVEGRLETAVILRVRDAAILQTLRKNSKTRDYIGESLGDLAATVRPNDWPKLRSAAAQLGLLLDVNV
ncbi:MAG: helicase-associated domain-containing protein, partial [Anaerolineae bacterium]